MINVAVCDDEKPFLNMMKKYLDGYFGKRDIEYSLECYSSGKDLLSDGIGASHFDIIFLDINMEELDGIKVAREIRRYSDDVYIVFVTAYVKYSVEGYKVDAIRYILKSVDSLKESMDECLNTIIKKMNYRVPMKRFIFNECEKEVNIERIVYIESSLHRLEFHIMEDSLKAYTMYETLNNMEKELKDYKFVRVHQSQLVNLKYITGLNEHSKKIQGARIVTLSTGEELIVPKARFKSVKKEIVAYRGEL